MSLFGDVTRGALGFSTGGLSELGMALNQGGGGSRGPAPIPQPLADPSTITANAGLMATLGASGQKQQNDINSLYSRIRSGFKADSKARGVAPSPYAEGRLNTAQDLSGQNLRNSLEAVLGNTAYSDFQGQRGYNQQEALAREVAALNKPSTLEEILGGLSGAAGVGGGLYGALGNKTGSSGGYSASPAPYDYGAGANPYGTSQNFGDILSRIRGY